MFATAIASVFLVSFLLGSIPWGVIVSRLFFHTDVRQHGSGNIGATNALRTLGKKGGAAVFALDVAKGLLSGAVVGLVSAMLPSQTPLSTVELQVLSAMAFLACTWGHIFSPWLGFKGGKGIAVAFGCMMVAFGPVPGLIELTAFIVVVAVLRYVSLGSIVAALLCPVAATFVFWPNAWAIVLCSLAAATVVWAHRANIERLRAHAEPKLGSASEDR